LNPTPGRENPAFSRTATVKDRHRPSRIVPDRHNLGGADELSGSTATRPFVWVEIRHEPCEDADYDQSSYAPGVPGALHATEEQIMAILSPV
jgi:hypothetical protein